MQELSLQLVNLDYTRKDNLRGVPTFYHSVREAQSVLSRSKLTAARVRRKQWAARKRHEADWAQYHAVLWYERWRLIGAPRRRPGGRRRPGARRRLRRGGARPGLHHVNPSRLRSSPFSRCYMHMHMCM